MSAANITVNSQYQIEQNSALNTYNSVVNTSLGLDKILKVASKMATAFLMIFQARPDMAKWSYIPDNLNGRVKDARAINAAIGMWGDLEDLYQDAAAFFESGGKPLERKITKLAQDASGFLGGIVELPSLVANIAKLELGLLGTVLGPAGDGLGMMEDGLKLVNKSWDMHDMKQEKGSYKLGLNALNTRIDSLNEKIEQQGELVDSQDINERELLLTKLAKEESKKTMVGLDIGKTMGDIFASALGGVAYVYSSAYLGVGMLGFQLVSCGFSISKLAIDHKFTETVSSKGSFGFKVTQTA